MASSPVTVPGPGGSTITIAPPVSPSVPGNNAVLAIAYAISTITGANYTTPTVTSGANTVLAAPSTTGPGVVNTAIVTGPTSGAGVSISVPAGYNNVIIDSDVPTTVTANDTAIVTGTSGGAVNVSGTSSVAAAGGNNSITASGDYTVALGGSGNNTIDATGAGSIVGSTGQNLFVTIDPPLAGNVIRSIGTDTIVSSGLTTVTASGDGTQIWNMGNAPGTQQIGLNGAHDYYVVTDGTASVSVAGTNDSVYGGFDTGAGAVSIAVGGDTSSSGGSNAAVVLSDSSATISAGSSATSLSLFGGFDSNAGSYQASVAGNNLFAYAANGKASITASGANALIYGGFSSIAGTLAADLEGTAATVVAGNSNITVTAGGGSTNATIYGSFAATPKSLVLDDSGEANTLVIGTSNASVNASGGDATIYGAFGASPGSLSASVMGNKNLMIAANSGIDASIGNGAQRNSIYGGYGSSAGAVNVSDAGYRTYINPLDANANVTLAGSQQSTVYGSFDSVENSLAIVANSATSDDIVAGSSDVAVTAAAGTNGLMVFGGSGKLSFVGIDASTTTTIYGGSGPQSISVGGGLLADVLGSGSATITTGLVPSSAVSATAVTLFGTAGDTTMLVGSAGGAVFFAGLGNETLNAAGSSANNTLWGGQDSKGADSFVGGSGNDTLIAGSGAETLTGGAGNNLFLFMHPQTSGTGANDVVTDFLTGNNKLSLYGYGNNPYTASVSGGNTTLTLSDNTKITFLNVTSLSQIQSHITSG